MKTINLKKYYYPICKKDTLPLHSHELPRTYGFVLSLIP